MFQPLADLERRDPFAYNLAFIVIFVATAAFVLFASFSASLAFSQANPKSALVTAAIYSGLSAAFIWFVWKCSPNRQQHTSLIKALYGPLLIMITFTTPKLVGAERWSMQHAAIGAFVFFSISSMVGLLIWHWRLRHPKLAKPDSQGWRAAKHITYGRFAPTPIVVLSVALAIGLAHLPLMVEVNRTRNLVGINPTVFFGFFIFPFLKFIVVGLGQLYASTPYIWVDESGISVGDRFFIDWSDVDRLEIHRLKTRAAEYDSGIDVFRIGSKSDDYMTIAFSSVQEKPSDELKLLLASAPTAVAQRSIKTG